MRVLVTGANGFVGRHVVHELRQSGDTVLLHGLSQPDANEKESYYRTDLCDADALNGLIKDLQPEACIHLAGIAFIPEADQHPASTFAVNTTGTVNLLTAFRYHAPESRIVVITSSQIYGHPDQDRPITENHPLVPYNLYSVSKTAADQASLIHAERFGMKVMTARPHNHIGPGQSPRFVSSSFSRQLIGINNGDLEPVIKVGNLDSERDFLDVRDVAHAYRLLLESGQPGRAYNIATGKPVPVRILLDELCRLAGVYPQRVEDPDLFRPIDRAVLLDTTRIHKDTGWRPRISFEQTLRDILEDVRTSMR